MYGYAPVKSWCIHALLHQYVTRTQAVPCWAKAHPSYCQGPRCHNKRRSLSRRFSFLRDRKLVGNKETKKSAMFASGQSVIWDWFFCKSSPWDSNKLWFNGGIPGHSYWWWEVSFQNSYFHCSGWFCGLGYRWPAAMCQPARLLRWGFPATSPPPGLALGSLNPWIGRVRPGNRVASFAAQYQLITRR